MARVGDNGDLNKVVTGEVVVLSGCGDIRDYEIAWCNE